MYVEPKEARNLRQYLYDTPPRVFNPDLAVALGLNEAIVLQQIHYWLQRSTHSRSGRKWAYNTYQEWQQKDFPFWSVATVRRTISRLEQLKIVLSQDHNKLRTDRTKWYSIDYEALDEYLQGTDQNEQMGSTQNDLTIVSKRADHLLKLSSSVPNRSTKTTTNNYDAILNSFKKYCPQLPQPREVTETRKRMIEEIKVDVDELFQIAGQSRFLNGENEWCWKASFDWLLRPENATKVLEGFYQNSKRGLWVASDYEYSTPTNNLDFFDFLKDDTEEMNH